MPEYDPKKKKWYIGKGKKKRYHKSKASATRSYRAYKAKSGK